MILAVDFDGTICENKFPDIGAPKIDVIRALKQLQQKGYKLILWTCRTGELLEEAVFICRHFGLEFDAVNDDLPEIKARFGENSRKIYFDAVLDDKNILLDAPSCDRCSLRRNGVKRAAKNTPTWCANTCKNYRSKT